MADSPSHAIVSFCRFMSLLCRGKCLLRSRTAALPVMGMTSEGKQNVLQEWHRENVLQASTQGDTPSLHA